MFCFSSSFVEQVECNGSGSLNKSFGGRHSIRDDGVVVNLVVTTPHVGHNFFQQKWSNLLNRVCKLVAKNVKTKEKMSCNCSNDNHPTNETVVLITPILKKRDNKTMDFCVTWYVNCSYVNYETSFNYRNVSPPEMTPWQLYEECEDKFDALTNDLDECQHA